MRREHRRAALAGLLLGLLAVPAIGATQTVRLSNWKASLLGASYLLARDAGTGTAGYDYVFAWRAKGTRSPVLEVLAYDGTNGQAAIDALLAAVVLTDEDKSALRTLRSTLPGSGTTGSWSGLTYDEVSAWKKVADAGSFEDFALGEALDRQLVSADAIAVAKDCGIKQAINFSYDVVTPAAVAASAAAPVADFDAEATAAFPENTATVAVATCQVPYPVAGPAFPTTPSPGYTPPPAGPIPSLSTGCSPAGAVSPCARYLGGSTLQLCSSCTCSPGVGGNRWAMPTGCVTVPATAVGTPCTPAGGTGPCTSGGSTCACTCAGTPAVWTSPDCGSTPLTAAFLVASLGAGWALRRRAARA